MKFRPLRATLVACALVATAACGDSSPPQNLQLKAETVLPPGQSGFWNSDGQAAGSASGDPADYGEHVDDQRQLYWSFGAKPAALGGRPGTAVVPIPGVEIYRDDYGVPIVYAGTAHDLWFGVGYAIAQDRLFLMDAVRRTGAGTLAELAGCGAVPEDAEQRVLTYSDTEYQQMFDALSQDSKEFIQGYIDGANAWRAEVMADPGLMPAEYTLLSATPAEFTVKDVLAAGVYITRFVAAEGGNEFLNIKMLQQLEQEYGSRAEAFKAFQDMVWLEDPRAVTTVPAESRFSNQAEPAAGREAVFEQMANWAMGLPDTIWKGVGTGDAPEPDNCNAASARLQRRSGATRMLAAAPRTRLLERAQSLVRRLQRDGRAAKDGHSFAFAIGRSRTRDRGALLISAPQLGYSYPLLLAEYEVHGAGYDARGVSVPILPVVGIGYTADVAWGLTTGYSKTIDSFIETLCSTGQQSAGTCAANQYFHDGAWKPLECRTETVNYRQTSNGVPVGTPDFSSDFEVCRTVHGPLVARDDAAGLGRSLQYAMFGRELQTVEGVREWNRAHSLEQFLDGVRKVTWNENVTFATRRGDIGYVHPGVFLRRHPDGDMRLPLPGTGGNDFGAPLPFAMLPQVINPGQGFLANWNNKPALGWLDGEGYGSTSRAGGPGQRVTNLLDKLSQRGDWRFADLRDIDRHAGTTDPRAREYLPLIAEFRVSSAGQLGPVQRAVLDRILAWDHRHYGDGIDPAADPASWLDSPGATLFAEFVTALRDELFGSLKNNVLEAAGTGTTCGALDAPELSIYSRIAGVGSHRFDQSVMDNLVLRVLAPESSGLQIRRDYTGGRTRDAVMRAALDTALQRLADQYNGGNPLAAPDLENCRRTHPASRIPSLTEAVGPGSDAVSGECVPMPYQDRGSWVHRVGFEGG